MTETILLIRTWLIAGVTCIALATGCSANSTYQHRMFKEAALAKGMSATQIDCAWDSTATGNGVPKPQCVMLAQKP